MNDQGQIQQFKTDEEAKAAGFTTKLTHEEAQSLEDVPEADREIELMWIKFWNNQRATRRPNEKLGMRHAFITGCKVMLAKINAD